MSKAEKQSDVRSVNEISAANYIGLAPATLRQARCHGEREGKTPVPKHIKIGRSVRYLREDLDQFLDEMSAQMSKVNGGVN
jgi:hypothetical protein